MNLLNQTWAARAISI